MEQEQGKQQLPGLIVDIDGVLIKGKQGIPRSKETLQILEKTTVNGQKIPFILLTNGGGNLEKNHVKVVNTKMGIENESYRLKDEQMILNFTPLRPIIEEYRRKDQLILIAGAKNYVDLMYDMGVQKFITVHEYSKCFPQICPLQLYTQDDIDEARRIIRERLQLGDDFQFENNQDYLQVFGIMCLYEPLQQEECIQLICDLCTTEDGRISKEYPFEKPKSHVPIYIVNNDLVYKDVISIPRLASGSFNMMLEISAKTLYDIDLNIDYYGKPEKKVYDFAIQKLRDQNPDIDITKFYMIGDNPKSDIKGANNAGIESILVQSGIYQESENDKENPGTYFVKDFYDAIQTVLQQENIQLE